MVQPGAKGSDAQKDKQLGQWIYRNADQLGRGGNGTVYQARSAADGTLAAVKILSPKAAKQADRAGRFDTEIRALNELRDPGVLPLIDQYDPGADTVKWYAMPIATPLLDALDGDRRPERILDIIATVAETLARLSETFPGKDFGHRDLKPDNLLLHEGRPVIGDFGLVALPDRDNLTAEGVKLGPAFFIAPEMLLHPESAKAAPADVYSLAKTLWALLKGVQYATPGAHRASEAHFSLTGDLGDHTWVRTLDRLLERATSTEPTNRPTMRQFADELRDVLARRDNEPAVMAARFGRRDQIAAPSLVVLQRQSVLRNAFDKARTDVDLLIGDVFGELQPTLGPGFRDHFGQTEPNDAYNLVSRSTMPVWHHSRGVMYSSIGGNARAVIRFSVYARTFTEDGEPIDTAAQLMAVHRHQGIEHTVFNWSDTGSASLGSEQFAQLLSGYLDAVKESGPSYLRAVNAIGDLPEDEVPDWYLALRQ